MIKNEGRPRCRLSISKSALMLFKDFCLLNYSHPKLFVYCGIEDILYQNDKKFGKSN